MDSYSALNAGDWSAHILFYVLRQRPLVAVQ
jgi:hypothetical protein